MVRAGSHMLLAMVCSASLGMPAMAERVVNEPAQFPTETAAVVAATVTLFEEAEARDTSPSRPALQLSPVATPASATLSSSALEAFQTERGPVRHLTGYRITWYPVDNLIGAVDFMGTWDNARNLVCGYVTWDVSDPDNPVMQNLITNYVELSEIDGADRAARESALLEANCAFGDIEQNYAALN